MNNIISYYRFLIFLLLSLPLLLGGSCDKRKFSFVSTVNQIVTFEDVESEDRSFHSIIVTTNDIKKNLDIPKDGEITEVLIGGLGLVIIPKSNNEAENIDTFGGIKSNEGLQKTLWDKQTTSTTFSSTYTHINKVLESGVFELRNVLEEALLVNENRTYTLILEVRPWLGKLVVDVQLKIDVQVEYEQCIEVWDYLDAGGDCNL